MPTSVVLLELNEVPWTILDDHLAHRPGSALARVLARSRCFTSVAADQGHLSPWTTWPTLHRGVDGQSHLIASFGQDRGSADAQFPPVWSLVRDAGLSAGVCGSLHSYPAPEDLDEYAFYLPDAFASEPVAHPADLVDFQAFNLSMSRRSARNIDTGVAKTDALRVLRHSRRLGIRPQTYLALARQLLDERRRPAVSNRRRAYQAVLQFDVFAHQLELSRPRLSTFFTNHVASAMHRYWAAHRPGDYERLELGEDWMETFGAEVMWATDRAVDMVARLAAHVEATPGAQLWIASSMGQAATIAQKLETQLYATQPTRLLAALGLRESEWELRPAMLPYLNLVVDDGSVDRFTAALRAVTVAGRPLQFARADNGFFSLKFGHPNVRRPGGMTISGQERELGDVGLEAVEITDRSGTTAYHVPQGVLAIYDPADGASADGSRPEVSVLEVAPALLRTLGVEPPDYMAEPTLLSPGAARAG